ncbi:MAG TPA: hypothetical protein VLC55_12155, partial [Burkholderiales bacterium]|nr:hypothetical protein [Burkholderiales bacterium]
MRPVLKSAKLTNVCYDIRGPVLTRARQMEEEGHRIIKLNIGNPAAFGFEAPEEIVEDVIHNLPNASGYCDSKGLFPARKAIMQYCQQKAIRDVKLDDIWVGNGVSELIVFADEIYDKVVYDGLSHTSIASLADDVLCVTFNGLSKNYRA